MNIAQAQFVTDGLVSHWSFDEIDGATVMDSAGENHGTINGDPQVVDGWIGQALMFDGDGDFVDIPGTDSLNFDGKTEVTASAWVNIAGHSGSCCDPIVSQRDAPAWALRYDNRDVGAEIEFIVRNPGWVGDSSDFGAPVPATGEWHFITGVLTGDKVLLYIDNELIDETDFVDTILSDGPGTKIASAVDGFFMGIIDEALIYDRALSASEVEQNFGATTAVESVGKLATHWAKIKVSR